MGVGFATESYAASALYTTLASLSGALWRIRRARKPAGAGLVYTLPSAGGSSRHARLWRGSPCRPPWCDQIPTPAENQLYPYLEHTCAHRDSHGFGKLFGESNHRKPGVVMSIIPLDFQRRCEQRWAARFAREAPEPSSQKSEQEKQGQQLGAPASGYSPATATIGPAIIR